MMLIEILTWISIFSGGALILLMLVSLIAGSETDMEVSDGDADVGGIGVLKGGLMFIAVFSWVMKIILETETPIYMAILAGLLAGLVSVLFLSWIFKLLLKNQHEVNWSPDEAVGKTGKVYLKIPVNGSGIINVEIHGALRELKAKNLDDQEIPTGSNIFINDYEDGFAQVTIMK